MQKEKQLVETICNMCGNKFTDEDATGGLQIHHTFGYGSKYDGDTIELDLCAECSDRFFTEMISKCSVNPIYEAD